MSTAPALTAVTAAEIMHRYLGPPLDGVGLVDKAGVAGDSRIPVWVDDDYVLSETVAFTLAQTRAAAFPSAAESPPEPPSPPR